MYAIQPLLPSSRSKPVLDAWRAADLDKARLDLIGSWQLGDRLKRDLPKNVRYFSPVGPEQLREQAIANLKLAREANRVRNEKCKAGCPCDDDGDGDTNPPQPEPNPNPNPQPQPNPDPEPPTKDGCDSGMSDETRDAEYHRILERLSRERGLRRTRPKSVSASAEVRGQSLC